MRERDPVVKFFGKRFEVNIRGINMLEEIGTRLFGNIAGCHSHGFDATRMTGFGSFNRVF